MLFSTTSDFPITEQSCTLLRHMVVTKEPETEYSWKTMLCGQSLREKQGDENVLGGLLLYACMYTRHRRTHVIILW